MLRNPYEAVVLEKEQDFEFFAGVVISRLIKTAKPATRMTCLQAIFNELKNSVSYEELAQVERNFKDLYIAKKDQEVQSAPPPKAKKPQFAETVFRGKKTNLQRENMVED